MIDLKPHFDRYEDHYSVSFDQLRHMDTSRAKRWHGSDPAFGWTVMEWASAAAGEAGEMLDEAIKCFLLSTRAAAAVGRAANIAKKIRRVEQNLERKSPEGLPEFKEKLAEECADVVIYLDLLCSQQGIDLGEAVRAKFNKVSETYNFPERL